MPGDGVGHGGYALKGLAGALGIGDLETVLLVERHDQLEGVHRIQSETAGAKECLVVANFFRGDLEHEVRNHKLLDVLFQCRRIIHRKTAARCLTPGTCSKIGPRASLKPQESRKRSSVLKRTAWCRLCHDSLWCQLTTGAFMVRALPPRAGAARLSRLSWGMRHGSPVAFVWAKPQSEAPARGVHPGPLAHQPRKSRERSQRRLRPGKAATGPTTSRATTLPVPIWERYKKTP